MGQAQSQSIQPRRYSPLLRSVSLLLAAAFLLQDISHAAPVFLAPRGAVHEPAGLKISPSFASISETHKGSQSKLLIHIQDAHTNLSAQENLAKVLEELITRYKVKTIFVEGGTKDDSLTFLRPLAPQKTRERVARKFLVNGEINGAEYLNLSTDYDMKLLGVEDPALYDKNLKIYASIAAKRESLLSYLDEIKKRVDILKGRLYPKEMVMFDNFLTRYERKEKNFTDYYDWMSAAAQKQGINLFGYPNFLSLKELKLKEQEIDFKEANAENERLIQALLQTGAADAAEMLNLLQGLEKLKFQSHSPLPFYESLLEQAKQKNLSFESFPNLLKYVQYLKLYSTVNLESLLDETKNLEEVLFRQALQTQDSLTLYEISGYLKILRNLFLLQVSKEHYEAYREKQSDARFDTVVLLAFLNKKLYDLGNTSDILRYLPVIEENKAEIEDFYKTTEARDEVFLKNALSAMEKEKLSGAVLVTGGYHTPNLTSRMKERGFSYVVVTPHVIHETNVGRYEALLLGQSGSKKARTSALNIRAAVERAGTQVPERLAWELGQSTRLSPVSHGARLSADSGRMTRESWEWINTFRTKYVASKQKKLTALNLTEEELTRVINNKVIQDFLVALEEKGLESLDDETLSRALSDIGDLKINDAWEFLELLLVIRLLAIMDLIESTMADYYQAGTDLHKKTGELLKRLTEIHDQKIQRLIDNGFEFHDRRRKDPRQAKVFDDEARTASAVFLRDSSGVQSDLDGLIQSLRRETGAVSSVRPLDLEAFLKLYFDKTAPPAVEHRSQIVDLLNTAGLSTEKTDVLLSDLSKSVNETVREVINGRRLRVLRKGDQKIGLRGQAMEVYEIVNYDVDADLRQSIIVKFPRRNGLTRDGRPLHEYVLGKDRISKKFPLVPLSDLPKTAVTNIVETYDLARRKLGPYFVPTVIVRNVDLTLESEKGSFERVHLDYVIVQQRATAVKDVWEFTYPEVRQERFVGPFLKLAEDHAARGFRDLDGLGLNWKANYGETQNPAGTGGPFVGFDADYYADNRTGIKFAAMTGEERNQFDRAHPDRWPVIPAVFDSLEKERIQQIVNSRIKKQAGRGARLAADGPRQHDENDPQYTTKRSWTWVARFRLKYLDRLKEMRRKANFSEEEFEKFLKKNGGKQFVKTVTEVDLRKLSEAQFRNILRKANDLEAGNAWDFLELLIMHQFLESLNALDLTLDSYVMKKGDHHGDHTWLIPQLRAIREKPLDYLCDNLKSLINRRRGDPAQADEYVSSRIDASWELHVDLSTVYVNLGRSIRALRQVQKNGARLAAMPIGSSDPEKMTDRMYGYLIEYVEDHAKQGGHREDKLHALGLTAGQLTELLEAPGSQEFFQTWDQKKYLEYLKGQKVLEAPDLELLKDLYKEFEAYRRNKYKAPPISDKHPVLFPEKAVLLDHYYEHLLELVYAEKWHTILIDLRDFLLVPYMGKLQKGAEFNSQELVDLKEKILPAKEKFIDILLNDKEGEKKVLQFDPEDTWSPLWNRLYVQLVVFKDKIHYVDYAISRSMGARLASGKDGEISQSDFIKLIQLAAQNIEKIPDGMKVYKMNRRLDGLSHWLRLHPSFALSEETKRDPDFLGAVKKIKANYKLSNSEINRLREEDPELVFQYLLYKNLFKGRVPVLASDLKGTLATFTEKTGHTYPQVAKALREALKTGPFYFVTGDTSDSVIQKFLLPNKFIVAGTGHKPYQPADDESKKIEWLPKTGMDRHFFNDKLKKFDAKALVPGIKPEHEETVREILNTITRAFDLNERFSAEKGYRREVHVAIDAVMPPGFIETRISATGEDFSIAYHVPGSLDSDSRKTFKEDPNNEKDPNNDELLSEMVQLINKELKAQGLSYITAARGGYTTIDLITANKGNALEALTKESLAPNEYFVYFGDQLYRGGNDHSALRIAGIGVEVGPKRDYKSKFSPNHVLIFSKAAADQGGTAWYIDEVTRARQLASFFGILKANKNKSGARLAIEEKASILPVEVLRSEESLKKAKEWMRKNRYIFGTGSGYDIRINKAFEEREAITQLFYWLGRIFGKKYLKNKGKSLVTGDQRPTSDAFRHAFAEGLADEGVNVVTQAEGNVITTGLPSRTGLADNFDLVMQVTGSHNPPESNGGKIMIRGASAEDGKSQELNVFFENKLTDLMNFVDAQTWEAPGPARGEILYSHDLIKNQIEALNKVLSDLKHPPSLIADFRGGAAGAVCLGLAEKKGYHVVRLESVKSDLPKEIFEGDKPVVIALNFEPSAWMENGIWDPSKKEAFFNIKALQQRIYSDPRFHKKRYFAGVTFDGDGDRSGFATEWGDLVLPERMLIHFYKDFVDSNEKGIRVLNKLGHAVELALDVRGSKIIGDVLDKIRRDRGLGVVAKFAAAGYPNHRAFVLEELKKIEELVKSHRAELSEDEQKAVRKLMVNYTSAEASGHFFFNMLDEDKFLQTKIVVDDGIPSAFKYLHLADILAPVDIEGLNDLPIIEKMDRLFTKLPVTSEIRLEQAPNKVEEKQALAERIMEVFARKNPDLMPMPVGEFLSKVRAARGNDRPTRQNWDEKLLLVDGIRVVLTNGVWILLRKSNTSAVIVFKAEADSQDKKGELIKTMELLRAAMMEVKSSNRLEDEPFKNLEIDDYDAEIEAQKGGLVNPDAAEVVFNDYQAAFKQYFVANAVSQGTDESVRMVQEARDAFGLAREAYARFVAGSIQGDATTYIQRVIVYHRVRKLLVETASKAEELKNRWETEEGKRLKSALNALVRDEILKLQNTIKTASGARLASVKEGLPPAFFENYGRYNFEVEDIKFTEVVAGQTKELPEGDNPLKKSTRLQLILGTTTLQAMAGASYAGMAKALGMDKTAEQDPVNNVDRFGKIADGAAVTVGRKALEFLAKAYDITIVIAGNEGKTRDGSAALPEGTVINKGGKNGIYFYTGDSIEVTNGVKTGEKGSSSMMALFPVSVPFEIDGYRVSLWTDFPHTADLDPIITQQNTLQGVLTKLAASKGISLADLPKEYEFLTLSRGKNDVLIEQAKALGFQEHTKEDGDPVPGILRAIYGIPDKNGKKLIVITTGGGNEHRMAQIIATLYGRSAIATTYASTKSLKKVDEDVKKKTRLKGDMETARDWQQKDLEEFVHTNEAIAKTNNDLDLKIPSLPTTPDTLKVHIEDETSLAKEIRGNAAVGISSITGGLWLDAGIHRDYLSPVTYTLLPRGRGAVEVKGFVVNEEGRLFFFQLNLKTNNLLESRDELLSDNDYGLTEELKGRIQGGTPIINTESGQVRLVVRPNPGYAIPKPSPEIKDIVKQAVSRQNFEPQKAKTLERYFVPLAAWMTSKMIVEGYALDTIESELDRLLSEFREVSHKRATIALVEMTRWVRSKKVLPDMTIHPAVVHAVSWLAAEEVSPRPRKNSPDMTFWNNLQKLGEILAGVKEINRLEISDTDKGGKPELRFTLVKSDGTKEEKTLVSVSGARLATETAWVDDNSAVLEGMNSRLNSLIKESFAKGQIPKQAYSEMLDEIVLKAADLAGLPEGVVLLAAGSYGRREQVYGTDFDFLIVVSKDTPVTPELETKLGRFRSLLERIDYRLDKHVVPSERFWLTEDEYVKAMEDKTLNPIQRNIVLDFRDIRSTPASSEVLKNLRSNFTKHYLTPGSAEHLSFLGTLKTSLDTFPEDRDGKFLVKLGKGGLRNISQIIWAGRVLTGITEPADALQELRKKGLLTDSQVFQLNAALDFLMRLRARVNLNSPTSSPDILEEVWEPIMAQKLGYGLDDFRNELSKYRYHVQAIGRDMSERLEAAIGARLADAATEASDYTSRLSGRFLSRPTVASEIIDRKDKLKDNPKFESSLLAKPFYGLTTIAWIKPNMPLFDRLVSTQHKIREALKAAGYENVFAWLDPASFHMTVADIDPGTDRWNKRDEPFLEVPKELVLERIDQVTRGFSAMGAPGPIKARVDGIGMKGVITGLVRFPDTGELLKVRRMESSIKAETGSDTRQFTGHISLGYFVNYPKEDGDVQKIVDILRLFENEDLGEFVFEDFDLTYFTDMNHFIPLLTKHLKTGAVARHESNIVRFTGARLADLARPVQTIMDWQAEQQPLPESKYLRWVMGSGSLLTPIGVAKEWKPGVKVLVTGGVGLGTSTLYGLRQGSRPKTEVVSQDSRSASQPLDALDQETSERLFGSVSGPGAIDRLLDEMAKLKKRDEGQFWQWLENKFHIRAGLDQDKIKQGLDVNHTSPAYSGKKLWREMYEAELSPDEKNRIDQGYPIEKLVIERLLDHETRETTKIPEGMVYYAALVEYGVDPNAILVDAQSTTSFENIELGYAILEREGLSFDTVVLTQQAMGQRRGRLTFMKNSETVRRGLTVVARATAPYKGHRAISQMTEQEIREMAVHALNEVGKAQALPRRKLMVAEEIPAEVLEAEKSIQEFLKSGARLAETERAEAEIKDLLGRLRGIEGDWRILVPVRDEATQLIKKLQYVVEHPSHGGLVRSASVAGETRQFLDRIQAKLTHPGQFATVGARLAAQDPHTKAMELWKTRNELNEKYRKKVSDGISAWGWDQYTYQAFLDEEGTRQFLKTLERLSFLEFFEQYLKDRTKLQVSNHEAVVRFLYRQKLLGILDEIESYLLSYSTPSSPRHNDHQFLAEKVDFKNLREVMGEERYEHGVAIQKIINLTGSYLRSFPQDSESKEFVRDLGHLKEGMLALHASLSLAINRLAEQQPLEEEPIPGEHKFTYGKREIEFLIHQTQRFSIPVVEEALKKYGDVHAPFPNDLDLALQTVPGRTIRIGDRDYSIKLRSHSRKHRSFWLDIFETAEDVVMGTPILISVKIKFTSGARLALGGPERAQAGQREISGLREATLLIKGKLSVRVEKDYDQKATDVHTPVTVIFVRNGSDYRTTIWRPLSEEASQTAKLVAKRLKDIQGDLTQEGVYKLLSKYVKEISSVKGARLAAGDTVTLKTGTTWKRREVEGIRKKLVHIMFQGDDEENKALKELLRISKEFVEQNKDRSQEEKAEVIEKSSGFQFPMILFENYGFQASLLVFEVTASSLSLDSGNLVIGSPYGARLAEGHNKVNLPEPNLDYLMRLVGTGNGNQVFEMLDGLLKSQDGPRFQYIIVNRIPFNMKALLAQGKTHQEVAAELRTRLRNLAKLRESRYAYANLDEQAGLKPDTAYKVLTGPFRVQSSYFFGIEISTSGARLAESVNVPNDTPNRLERLKAELEEVRRQIPFARENFESGKADAFQLNSLLGRESFLVKQIAALEQVSTGAPLAVFNTPGQPLEEQLKAWEGNLQAGAVQKRPIQRILINDDDQVTRFLVQRILERDLPNATIEVVSKSEDALTKFQNQSFDLVVTDRNTRSEMTGTQLIKAIRGFEDSRGRGISQQAFAVLISADEAKNIVKFMSAEGVTPSTFGPSTFYLEKPFEPNALVQLVKILGAEPKQAEEADGARLASLDKAEITEIGLNLASGLKNTLTLNSSTVIPLFYGNFAGAALPPVVIYTFNGPVSFTASEYNPVTRQEGPVLFSPFSFNLRDLSERRIAQREELTKAEMARPVTSTFSSLKPGLNFSVREEIEEFSKANPILRNLLFWRASTRNLPNTWQRNLNADLAQTPEGQTYVLSVPLESFVLDSPDFEDGTRAQANLLKAQDVKGTLLVMFTTQEESLSSQERLAAEAKLQSVEKAAGGNKIRFALKSIPADQKIIEGVVNSLDPKLKVYGISVGFDFKEMGNNLDYDPVLAKRLRLRLFGIQLPRDNEVLSTLGLFMVGTLDVQAKFAMPLELLPYVGKTKSRKYGTVFFVIRPRNANAELRRNIKIVRSTQKSA